MRYFVAGMVLMVSAVCVALVIVSVIHDLSDGKVDGVEYVNGCDR